MPQQLPILETLLKVQGSLELDGDPVTRDWEERPSTTIFPDLQYAHSFLPGKARGDTLSPVPPAFIGLWKPCPTKPGERGMSYPPRLSSPLDVQALIHHPNDADPFMSLLLCRSPWSAISALSQRRGVRRPRPGPGVYRAACGVRSPLRSVPSTPILYTNFLLSTLVLSTAVRSGSS